MGTTSNYSWPYPESTDPVADGAVDIQALADAADTTGRAIQLATVQVFADATARNTALSGIEIEGMFAFLQDTDALTYWDGSAWQEFSAGADDVIAQYVAIGGGGSGGSNYGGGGGAGGYISSVGTENSGGGRSTMPRATFVRGQSYTITIGAGGASNADGSPTDFASFRALGGGRGGVSPSDGRDGASGGGAPGEGSSSRFGGSAIGGGFQGYYGGNNYPQGGVAPAGGGGGAGGAGDNASSGQAGDGGVGVDSSITGSSVGRGGGGAGGRYSAAAGTATDGGGLANNPGTANTGGGGGGTIGTSGTSYSGGSGVVIIRFLTSDGSPTIGAGLTSSSSTDGDYTVIQFTAGSDTISWSV
jgi:hypothetical protein